MLINIRKTSDLNFQQRLSLGIVVLTILTTVTLGVIGSRFSENFLLKRFKDRMDFLGKYLAANCELGILLGDRAMLKGLAGNLLKEEDVAKVVIRDRAGNVLAEAHVPGEPGHYTVQTRVFLSTQSENLAFSTGEPNQRILGSVKIFYNTTGIEQLSGELQLRYAAVTFLIAAGGIIAFLMFSKSLTAPLEHLIEAAQDVAQGNLDVKLSEGSLPETRKLAHAFNTMTEALKQSRRDLEQTYQELIQQKALAEIGHFAVTIAHEVKNPLGIIKGALDILKKSNVDQATRETMITYMEDEITRLDRLIQDFLEFSRPKPLSFQQVDMDSLLSDIASKMNLEWMPKGIEIRLEITPSDQGFETNIDADLMERAIANIIKNACEVSEPGQHVTIRLSKEGGQISILIADHGPGVDETMLDKITEPFFTTKAKGTGLGLAFAKRVIDAHMGRLNIERNLPNGSVFNITLD